MEVLKFVNPEWVYTLKSVEKCLCMSRKYKTMAVGAILSNSAILKFWKKNTSTIYFLFSSFGLAILCWIFTGQLLFFW
jgi:hypothetical protein